MYNLGFDIGRRYFYYIEVNQYGWKFPSYLHFFLVSMLYIFFAYLLFL